jgi:phage shock protein E
LTGKGHINVDELRAAPGTRLVDVRKNPDERQIPGSERIDGASLEGDAPIPFSKDERVVLYCGSGNSCTRIAAALRDRGYNTVALEGGYASWRDAGLPTEPRYDLAQHTLSS